MIVNPLVLKQMKSFISVTSLITNSYADSDKVCFELLNSINNLNDLDSLKCAWWILFNNVESKSGFDSRYALGGSSCEIFFNITSQMSVSVYLLVLAFCIW